MRNPHHFLKFIVIAIFAIGVASCEGSKNEYDKIVLELNKTKADLEKAKTKIAEMENVSVQPRIADIKMQKQLTEAREKIGALAAQVKDLTDEKNRLQGLLEKIEARYAELEKKLKDFGVLGKDLKPSLPTTP